MNTAINTQAANTLIYLIEEYPFLSAAELSMLEQSDYQIRRFSKLSEIAATCKKEPPLAIIATMKFKNNDIVGADTIFKLTNEQNGFPPLIIISDSVDIKVRLAAVRAGAIGYFGSPIDINKLNHTLLSLTQKLTTPYRVLLLDGDKEILSNYQRVMSYTGIEVATLSEPLRCLQVMQQFKPDVLVLETSMPECSGTELAQVIRQDDDWALMPIMFLSTDSNPDRQLQIMSHGGDDFLTKPVHANHLIAAVVARASRARLIKSIHKELTDTLRDKEFHVATTNLHNLFSSTDVSGRILTVNDMFCEVSGYSREELVGQNHRILKSDYHPESFYQDMWQTISQGEVWHGTICNFNKSGKKYWVKSTIVPFLDKKGRPYKYVSARTEITAQLQSEAKLKVSEEHNRLLLESVGEGIFGMDTEGKATFVNPAFCKILGYRAEEIIGKPMHSIIHHTHADGSPYLNEQCPTTAAISDGKTYKVQDEIFWCKDGSSIPVEITSTPVTKEKDIVGAVVTFRNITERKRAQTALFSAKEEAENANQAKSKFLSSMSHELRTPLNAIMGFSQLMKMDNEQPLGEVQQDNINEIMNAGSHLLELINDILDLAKIESGQMNLSIESVILAESIADAIQLITPLAQKHGIDISLTFNGTELTVEQLYFKTISVQADNTRLRQVMLNLLSNAVKYNRENGKIIIACTNNNEELTRVSVSDTGSGLSPEQQSHLFKAFNRLDADHTDIEGTGIGLVITKNIVELMNGSIGVRSKLGEGSTFWFELPSENVAPDQTNASQKIVTGDLRPKKISEHEHTVLYIEDNPANLRLVTQLLGRLPNIYVWSAPEPYLGLELASEYNPDLILLDINLPGMDGYEVLKQLRKRGETRNTPVIAISANAMPKDIEKGSQAGFDDYITKPIDVKVLLDAVTMKLTGTRL